MESENLPNDADGDAIRRVVRDGADLTLPMAVDFAVAFASQDKAIAFQQLLAGSDFEALLEAEEDGVSWTCYCKKHMLLRYETVVQIQRELSILARPLGGSVDGWGTFGNADAGAKISPIAALCLHHMTSRRTHAQQHAYPHKKTPACAGVNFET